MNTPPASGEPWKPAMISKTRYRAYASGPQVIRTRPAHACKMMTIISSWSGIEYLMTEILAYTTNIEGWLAAELLSKIGKMPLKREFVIDAVGKMYGDTSREFAEKCLNFSELKKLQTERDRLAHGNFIVPDAGENDPDTVVRVTGYGDNVEWYAYTHAVLDAMIAKFDAVEMKVTHLWMQMTSFASARHFWAWVGAQNPPLSENDIAKLLGLPPGTAIFPKPAATASDDQP